MRVDVPVIRPELSRCVAVLPLQVVLPVVCPKLLRWFVVPFDGHSHAKDVNVAAVTANTIKYFFIIPST